jgi:hypothetical protein
MTAVDQMIDRVRDTRRAGTTEGWTAWRVVRQEAAVGTGRRIGLRRRRGA